MQKTAGAISVAIACGGSGGHLFPGIAVGEQLARRGCAVKLLVSTKRIDADAVRDATELESVVLPSVALASGRWLAFARGFLQSLRECRRLFRKDRPAAVLGMGGFTSAPPILAGRWGGACVFLHESNTIPGRANRWLARFVQRAFVGFPETAPRLRARRVSVVGTPVRACFQMRDPAPLRAALGLDPTRPVLLVMGGSQGASGINELMRSTVPLLAARLPELQYFHLTGPRDLPQVESMYAAHNLRARVHPFFPRMEDALGAATVAIGRAGASSLAELAALRVPSVLIPFPSAADNHQFHNAQAFERAGAARMLDQGRTPADVLAEAVLELLTHPEARETMRAALGKLDRPRSAEDMADAILPEIAGERGVNLAASPAAPLVQTCLK